jgi:hypothetical protein
MNTMFLNPDTWDLVVDDYGNIAMAESPYAIAQDVASACRLWLGEARYDTTRGIPYETSLLGELPPQSLIASWFETEAETVPEVESAQVVLSFDQTTRQMSGQIQITQTSSETTTLNLS